VTGIPMTPGTYSGVVTVSGSGLTSTTQSFTITISTVSSDTPTMPLLGVAILIVLLSVIAAGISPRRTA
jgi:hypothetical protein